ncbi:MAG: signal recognition particle protein [Planctomycetes bacterium]|nr:signal recognition particle protein [Planctomycetota bacterium]MCC7396387.1 signal recognition particle protein [Planctomycetota bacterium]
MFDSLANALGKAYRAIVGQKTLTEANVDDGIRAVRQALLEADVNFQVAKEFVADVRQRVVGQKVIDSVEPGQQFVKCFHDALTELLGGQAAGLPVADAPPLVLMMCGLQGSGKTTTCAKLALYLRKHKKKNPLLVAADLQRPAAVEQLQSLGKQLGIAVFAAAGSKRPPEVCKQGLAFAQANGHDVVILDTAGRLHIDEPLMQELQEVHAGTKPHGVLLVCDAMLGQDAVNSAKEFHARLPLHGLILTKVDGDSRGGAALSIVKVTGRPILFAGVGEKPDDLEPFDPSRMAGRILGMGDVVGLVEKAQSVIDEREAEKAARKLQKGQFNFEDFLAQMNMIRKLGPLKKVLGMLPGVGAAMKDVDFDDKHMKRLEAMILSMTPRERQKPDLIDLPRRRRIAAGSGNQLDAVNGLIKQFKTMQDLMKKLGKGGGMPPDLGGLMGGGGMGGMPGPGGFPGLPGGGRGFPGGGGRGFPGFPGGRRR